MSNNLMLYQLAEAQLEALIGALEVAPPRAAEMREVLAGLATACGDRSIALPPRWSGMSDDCSPIEWSVAFRRGTPDVRVLVEAHADPASPMSYWSAGVKLTAWLCEAVGADDTLAQKVVQLFEPSDPAAYFAAFHGVEFRHDGLTVAKVYLNPAAGGAAKDTLAKAFNRLGLGPAWSALQPEIMGAQLTHLGIDLEREPRARVKLYVRSHGLKVLRRVATLVGERAAADMDQTIAALCDGGVLRRGAYVVLYFAPGGSMATAAPCRAGFDLPVPAHCGNDEAAIGRISSLLEFHDLDAAAYRRAALALAAIGPTSTVPLRDCYGLHTYVSMQREPDGGPRVTVYFGLRAYALRHGWLALDPETTWPTPVISH